MTQIIQIDHLVYEYKREENLSTEIAVNGVTLQIKKGSFTAIIGRNGSGKSTLAKNLNALLLPTGGVVFVNGNRTDDESKLWEIRQTVGMVFQNPDNQLVSSIVEDDIAFGPENLGIEPEEIRKRVKDSLYAVNMYEERKKAPHLLSGGQKQRIAIAGVVAMRPECIIFDEPTAMLDPHGRQEVMEIIERLSRDGITVLLITHFMEEAARAERVIIMDQGDVRMDGSPTEIFVRERELREMNLDIPFAVGLATALREKGVAVPASLITTEEMVEFLCQSK